MFLIMILCIAIVGDIIVSRGLRKTSIREFAVWNDIYNGTNLDNDLVFLGSSSCWSAYNPLIVDSILGISTYNLSIVNHTWYPCQRLRYDTYARHANKKPKYVVINIDMGTLGAAIEEPMYEREQFFPYFWLDDSLISQVRGMKEFTIMDRYCPMWRYIGYRKWIEAGVASVFGKQHFEDDVIYKGYTGNTNAWERASLNILDSVTIICHSEEVNSIIQFIEERKSEGQEVILVKSPVYHELQERFTNREEMCARYDSIAKVTGVEVVDYWTHPIVHDSTYFYNSTHLNNRGADLISIQLAHDINSLINN